MCDRPNFEEEELAMDEAVIGLVRQWRLYIGQFLDDEEMQTLDCAEQFSQFVRDRVMSLRDEGRYPDVLGAGRTETRANGSKDAQGDEP